MFGDGDRAGELIEAGLTVLADLQRRGLVRRIGLSNVTPAQIAAGRRICDIVCVQNHYNLAHRIPYHRELVTEPIKAGKSVYCEWPLGNGLAEAVEMAQLAKDRKLRGVVGSPATGKFNGFEHQIGVSTSLSDNRVTSVAIDHSGQVWAATHSGLDRLDRKNATFTTYYSKDGLASNRVHCLLEDQRDILWMSTSRGISSFDPVLKTFENYSMADGLPGTDLTGWRTCFESPSGEMFFGGFSGATAFYPDQVGESSYVPRIVLTDFRLAGVSVNAGAGSPLKESISYTRSLVLTHQQSMFSLEFSALSYSNSAMNRYRYMLRGLDSVWHQVASEERLVSYTTLPPGIYEFRVQGATSTGPWSEPGVALRIEILPPWWSTWWFRVACVALTLLLVSSAYRYRLRGIQRRSQQLELINARLEAQMVDRERAEGALSQAQEELTRANRVMLVGETAASVAHEVNQPIAANVTNASAGLRWLAANPPDLEEVRQALARIVSDGTRAGEVIGRIRAMVKKSPPRKEWLSINETIGEVLVLTASEVQKHGVSLQTELTEDLPLVHADRIQLQQVMLNLIKNAIESMSGANEGMRELRVSSAKDESKGVLVVVGDTGPGLDPKTSAQLFEHFYTTKAEGMGMGLAICRTIIEVHGGQLWATPNQPRGAIFQFNLPTDGDRTPPLEQTTPEMDNTASALPMTTEVDDARRSAHSFCGGR